jgi:hypothetical protein
VLLLKLVLVPSFLLLVTLAGRRWGAATAGWLAGLPVVAGPILFFISQEQGASFAATATVSSLGAVFCSLCFSVVYAQVAQRQSWPFTWAAAVLAWLSGALLSWFLPANVFVQGALALGALVVAPKLFPRVRAESSKPGTPLAGELAWRMLAGAALCWVVTSASAQLGPSWSGLLSVFPVLGSVLAIFTQRGQGPQRTAVLLAAMARGLYALGAFCLVLALLLPHLTVGMAFGLAIVASLSAQWMTRT